MAELPDRPGDPDSFLDELFGYIQVADPSFVAAVQGASNAEISQYEVASRAFDPGQPMPTFYRAFLQRMGKSHGKLFEEARLIVDIVELLDIYEDFVETEPEAINPRLPIAGRYVIGDQIALDLDTKPEDPEVVVTSGGKAYDWLSQSWGHLLAQTAVLYVERKRRKEGRWYSSSPESAARALGAAKDPQGEAFRRVDALATRLGLRMAWPSDARHRIALSNDAAFVAKLGRRGEAMLQVFTDRPTIYEDISATVPDALGMRSGQIR